MDTWLQNGMPRNVDNGLYKERELPLRPSSWLGSNNSSEFLLQFGVVTGYRSGPRSFVTKSLCVTVLATNYATPSFYYQGPAPGACTTALILLTETTGHFMPHGMLAEDIKRRCVGTEGESVAISQLAAC